jgi:hypothetical protein
MTAHQRSASPTPLRARAFVLWVVVIGGLTYGVSQTAAKVPALLGG